MKHRTFCDTAAHRRFDWQTCKSPVARIGQGAAGESGDMWLTAQTVESPITGRTLLTVTAKTGTVQLDHGDAERLLTLLELTLDPGNLKTAGETLLTFLTDSQADA